MCRQFLLEIIFIFIFAHHEGGSGVENNMVSFGGTRWDVTHVWVYTTAFRVPRPLMLYDQYHHYI